MKSAIFILICLLPVLSIQPLAAEYITVTDSLKSLGSDLSQPDTTRIKAYIALTNAYQQTEPDSAFYYADRALSIARDINHPYYFPYTEMHLASALIRKANYEDALLHLNNAFSLLTGTEYLLLKAKVVRRIGTVYFIQFKYEEARSYYNDALDLLATQPDSVEMSRVYDNIAGIFYEKDEPDSALHYYSRSLKLVEKFGTEMQRGILMLNIGMLYERIQDYQKAVLYSEKALEIAEKHNAQVMKTYPLKVLSTVAKNEGRYVEAEKFARQSLQIASAMDLVYEMKDAHHNLSSAYEYLQRFDSALVHYKAYKSLQDSMLNEDANARLAEMRARYESEKKEQEITLLETENEAQKARTIAITSSLGLVLIFTGGGFIWFGARKKKQVQLLEKDKIIAESRKKLAEEELENVKLREENLQKELTNYALHIVEKNDFLEELKSEMADLRVDIQNKDAIKSINKLGSKIYQNLMINKDREEFEIQVEQACSGFFKALENKYPELTSQERRLAALLRLNLSSKEISGILNISPKSVDQSRYRLRKKLELDKDIQLSQFFNQL